MNGLLRLKDRMDECVHCGMCLPTCPTYAELGTETDSPRGRIWLVRAVAEGRAEPTPALLAHLDGCLDCRACETACPSGVRYGEILEGARAELEPARRRPARARLLRRFALRSLLTNGSRLTGAARLLRALDRTGLRGLAAALPTRLGELARLAPRPDGPPFSTSVPSRIEAVPPVRGTVALFTGCVMDRAMAGLHHATARLLARNGFAVLVPKDQGCCGALHVHHGDPETARELTRRNVRAFAAAGADRVLVNSAGCGAQIAEAERLFPDDAAAARRAGELAARTEDVLVFLAREGLREPPPALRARAVYDEPCHLLHAQGISAAPKALLAKIPGLTLLPLPEADFCCGSAGVYNLTQGEMSRRLLDRKMERVVATGAELLITANPGCLLQLRAGAEARGLPLRVAHVVSLLGGS